MYHYDTLGDEKFQEFCQALISAVFPDAQCLPVGQPDGGRDAFFYHKINFRKNNLQSDKELIVFQVKYIKNPKNSRTEREMIEDVIKKEKDKIKRLKSAGMSKYYLITNLQGTSHYKSGSIDKVNDILTSEIGVNAYCWWRDDLDRRLDNHPQIKWSYPDILKATDLLAKLVAGQLGEDEERRKSAIRAYMSSQYEDDQELKFKQTDLRSTMADLFVDLPMTRSHNLEPSDEGRSVKIWRSHRIQHTSYGEQLLEWGDASIHSAEYLLGRKTETPERIVLEGAPGQGKSTVTQYVCQILRMHLLNKTEELQSVPPAFRSLPVRVPFRVDLRDLAKWISGIDPFESKPVRLDNSEPKSMEGFLASQVKSMSGGHTFSVSDLTAVARVSDIFLALDGFDEVADINLRQKLVGEITKGVNRLVSAGDASVTTVVTSRPAAFAKSVIFPKENWEYFELRPLERKQIDNYTTKWMKAKGLKSGEEAQLRKILDVKLREPHTQYLSKNPMQLTILLSLVYNRGPSLPEKRTSMYDAYMDMFFSRESEKSDVVRDNRELLIDIHRYLAWKLQTAAEAGDSGSIERGALRSTLFEYLDREGEDTSIVDSLFNGIIERVGALVSRVQETYEFEVQPLREYFAARHLYETSPYPADDIDCCGDKFERFKALAVNPYWLNVARFYGGCFNKGELLTLANELMELDSAPPYEFTSHPRSMAMMLLSDWVFSAYQPAVKKVIAFAGEHPQFRLLLANANEGAGVHWSGLPERSGRTEFLDMLWQRVLQSKFSDERQAASRAISLNSSVDERFERWKNARSKLSHLSWVQLGMFLGLFGHPDKIIDLSDELSDELIEKLVQFSGFKALQRSKYSDRAKNIILQNPRHGLGVHESSDDGRLAKLSSVFSVYQYYLVFFDENVPLRHCIERRARFEQDSLDVKLTADDKKALSAGELKAFEVYEQFLDTDTSVLSSTLEPWTRLVESMRSAWGDCAAIDQIAFAGAGVKSKQAEGTESSLSDTSDLVGLARFARLKSGAPRWWENLISSEENTDNLIRILHLLAAWGTSNTLVRVTETLDKALMSLSEEEWGFLLRRIYISEIGFRRSSGRTKKVDINKLNEFSSRLRIFIGRKLEFEQRRVLANNMMDTISDIGHHEGRFIAETVVREDMTAAQWKDAISRIKKLYQNGTTVPVGVSRKTVLSKANALRICKEPNCFPLSVLALADMALQSAAGAASPKLQEVAKRRKWFEQ